MRFLKSFPIAVAAFICVAAIAILAPTPAAAQAEGASCATNGNTAPGTAGSGGQNLVCSSGTWQYVPYQFGTTAVTCSSTYAGMVRWNSTSSILQFCNGSTWTTLTPCQLTFPISSYPTGLGCCMSGSGIIGDGTYIYQATIGGSGTVILAWAFNTSTKTWTVKSNLTTALSASAANMVIQGGVIFIAENTGWGGTAAAIEAWTFNGTTFTKTGSYTTSINPYWIWGDGTYLYVADNTNGVKAFSYSGGTFTLLGSAYTVSGINAQTIYGDGTYIYVGDTGKGKIRALTFNTGTHVWTLVTTLNPLASGNGLNGAGTTPVQGGITGDGTYLYFNEGAGVAAYTFNGTFTKVGAIDTHGGVTTNCTECGLILAKNGNIYMAGGSQNILAFSFNGTTFTYKGAIPGWLTDFGFWSDGSYVYINEDSGNGDWIGAFPICN